MSYKYFPKQQDKETKELKYTTVIRLSDNALIPMNNNNKDYQEVLKWVAEGNTIEEAD
tara:strand:- start:31 stop:204 length:174 start_codon:yes stop_codon:yes gene_type:complete